MVNKNITLQELVHKNERKYFIIAAIVSVITYIALIVSVIGIFYVGLFIGISMLLHALMLGFIRTNGVRLNPDQFPEVYDKVKELCAKMEMAFVPDVYVLESSGVINAFATRFFGRNMVVLYSTIFELIEQNAEDELAFVIAHELAHIKRRHISRQLMVLPALWIPGLTQAYSRACEYSCDRYAAYYTEKSEAAKNCLTILAIGKSLYKYVNRTSYLNQVNEEKGFFIWLSEVLSTHPPLPKRIHQIALFMDGTEEDLSYTSKKVWIWVPASIILLTVLIGGSIYAFGKLDTVLNDMETNLGTVVPNETESETPSLISAVVEGDIEKVNALLKSGVDPDLLDSQEWAALHWASKDINVDITKALLNAGANVDIQDYYGEVPLMKAAGDGNGEMVKLLIDAEANIDIQDDDNWTALMYAIVFGENIETVQVLLDAGANTELKDYQELTALMHAIQVGNKEIVQLLRNLK
jgi:Zn-dependent protease with chaperone function